MIDSQTPSLDCSPAAPVTHKSEIGLDDKSTALQSGLLREFFTAFITIFIAEIGDKTQLATLLMTAESQSPWIVFAGAAAALLTTSLFGVLLGRWLARRLSEDLLRTVTGAGLLLISVLLLWDMVHI